MLSTLNICGLIKTDNEEQAIDDDDECDVLKKWSTQFLYIYSNDQDIKRKQQENIDILSKIVTLFTYKYIQPSDDDGDDDAVYEGLSVPSDWSE